MTKVLKKDWMEAGLKILVTEGFGALTVDGLCSALEVTKGSFYHHFRNHAEFRDELLSYWEGFNTHEIVTMSQDGSANEPTIDNLMAVLIRQPAARVNPEIGFRAWASGDPAVRSSMERIDALRLQILEKAFSRMLPDPETAALTSRMFYALLVGSYSLFPPLEGPKLEQIYRRFLDCLLLPDQKKESKS